MSRTNAICLEPGCATIVPKGYCTDHTQKHPYRTSKEASYHTRRWREARKRHLKLHPLCIECLNTKRTTLATHVDHIEPHKGDPGLFWNEDNWQGLCTSHHSSKTGKENVNAGAYKRLAGW